MKKYVISVPDMASEHCRGIVGGVFNEIQEIESYLVLDKKVEVIAEAEFIQSGKLQQALLKRGYMSFVSEAQSEGDDAIERLQFNTNLNCSSCVDKVASDLDAIEELCEWNVETSHRDKILTVHIEKGQAEKVIGAVENKGFKIEKRLS